MSKHEYKGRCHCGSVRFSFLSDEITTGKRCNCSICVRKGIVMSSKYIPEGDFQLLQGAADLTDYRWNDRVVGHVFCRICGVSPFSDCHEIPGYGYRVNLGCVEGMDPFALDIQTLDGRSMEVNSNPGPHPGT